MAIDPEAYRAAYCTTWAGKLRSAVITVISYIFMGIVALVALQIVVDFVTGVPTGPNPPTLFFGP